MTRSTNRKGASSLELTLHCDFAPSYMSEALQRGTVVRIHGLHSKPSLNDALALVVGKHSEDRWVVRPTSSPDSVAVRDTNLHRARELSEGLRQSIFTAAALSVLLVALAARAGTRSRLRAFVPLASLLWYLVAVLGCYWVHSPLLGSGVYVPAISEMGVSSPARLLYRVAFGLCGFLLAVTLLQMYDLACSHHPEAGLPFNSTCEKFCVYVHVHFF